MNHANLLAGEKQTHTSCHLCGQLKELINDEVCADCVEATLLKHLPLLKRTLEDHLGAMLDRWLARGQLQKAKWTVESDFHINLELLKSFIREIVKEAVARGDIELQLNTGEYWKPIQINQLLNSLYEQCGEQAGQLTSWLAEAIGQAPTEEAGRELIEVVCGKKRLSKRYLREEAITSLVDLDAAPLSLPIRALIEMRYRLDRGRESFTQILAGEISSVWEKVRESLPEEVAMLICKDKSF